MALHHRRNRLRKANYIVVTESTHKNTQSKVQQWLYGGLEHGARITLQK